MNGEPLTPEVERERGKVTTWGVDDFRVHAMRAVAAEDRRRHASHYSDDSLMHRKRLTIDTSPIPMSLQRTLSKTFKPPSLSSPP